MRDIENALDVLSIFKRFDRYAVIAGGMPRDIYFKKEINDIDIYVRAIEGFNTVDYIHMIHNMFPTAKDIVNTGSCNSITIKWMHNTMTFSYNNSLVNVIFITNKHPSNVVSDFDFDICKFILSETGIPIPCFDIDTFNLTKISKLNPNISQEQMKYSIGTHLPKLKEKYPEVVFAI